MNVTYWTGFSKRKNSTKRPATTGTDATCVLKDDTSILFPDIDSATIPANANYMYISDFGRYYYVRDVTKIGANRNAFHLEIDPMASYKDSIGSYTAFIERAATGYDLNVPDEFISQKQDFVVTDRKDCGAMASWSSSGGYIIKVLGRDGITGYCVTEGVLNAIFAYSFDSDHYNSEFANLGVSFITSGLSDFISFLIKIMVKPEQYVKSVMWLPFFVNSGAVQNVALGWFRTVNCLGDIIGVGDMYAFYPSVITPMSAYYGDFRDYDSNWTKYDLFVPGFGNIPIDPMDLRENIAVGYFVDIYSGLGKVILYSGTTAGPILATYEAQIGVEVEAGSVNPSSAVTNGVSATAGIVSAIATKDAKKALGAIGGGIMAATQGFQGNSIGGAGCASDLIHNKNIILSRRVIGTKDIPTTVNGRPVQKNAQISGYSGFVQCGNASLDITGFPQEKDAVNAYMNSGFYYE